MSAFGSFQTPSADGPRPLLLSFPANSETVTLDCFARPKVLPPFAACRPSTEARSSGGGARSFAKAGRAPPQAHGFGVGMSLADSSRSSFTKSDQVSRMNRRPLASKVGNASCRRPCLLDGDAIGAFGYEAAGGDPDVPAYFGSSEKGTPRRASP